jgi:hypothetical protein
MRNSSFSTHILNLLLKSSGVNRLLVLGHYELEHLQVCVEFEVHTAVAMKNFILLDTVP